MLNAHAERVRARRQTETVSGRRQTETVGQVIDVTAYQQMTSKKDTLYGTCITLFGSVEKRYYV